MEYIAIVVKNRHRISMISGPHAHDARDTITHEDISSNNPKTAIAFIFLSKNSMYWCSLMIGTVNIIMAMLVVTIEQHTRLIKVQTNRVGSILQKYDDLYTA